LDVPAVYQDDPALLLENPCITAQALLSAQQLKDSKNLGKVIVGVSLRKAYLSLRIARKSPFDGALSAPS
jgi:hypothetical protein